MKLFGAAWTVAPVHAGAMGASDCEQLGDGWLVQPINALTSLAFVAIGMAVIGAVVSRPVDRVRTVVYGTCLAAIGLGSVMFHGPQPAGSQFAHDVPILLTAWFIVVQDLRLVSSRVQRDLTWFATGAAIATTLAIVDIGAIAPLTAFGVLAVVVLEAFIARRSLRPRGGRSGRQIATVILGVGAVAVATWVLGRTDSPLCDPGHPVQLHGLWHLLAAVLLGLWWWLACWLPTAETTTSEDHELPVAER